MTPEKKQAEERYRLQREISGYADIVQNMTAGLQIYEPVLAENGETLRLSFVNPAAAAMLGDAGLLLGQVLPAADQDAAAGSLSALALSVLRSGQVAEGEHRVRCRGERSEHTLFCRAFALPDGCVGVVLTEQVSHRNLYDDLTGLPNRRLLLQRLTAVLEHDPNVPCLLLIDVDGFRRINHSLGPGQGDELLAAVGERLRAGLRPGDTLARLGDDEFAVLLAGDPSPAEAAETADRIAQLVRLPFPSGNSALRVTASIGVVAGRTEIADAGELLHAADLALARAKQLSRGSYQIYSPQLRPAFSDRLRRLSGDLRQAMPHGEIRIYYQPVVNLATGTVVGLEALARWYHPQRGIIPTVDFIALAEETGLIVSIDHWMLDAACQQAQVWQQAYPADPPLFVGVNLSPRHLRQPGAIAGIDRSLRRWGLDPARLQLELSENALIQDLDLGSGVLHELKALGVRLALDDFGTGQASLVYLRRLPIDVVKVDRSFVAALGREESDSAIVQATVTLARSLGLTVCGEGVETEEQHRALQSMGCERGQGIYFAGPMPGPAITVLLRRILKSGSPAGWPEVNRRAAP